VNHILARILLLDIGSTFTKATVVDPGRPRILGSARAPTTAGTDITIGMMNAVSKLGADPDDFDQKLACSSAAGGLEVAAIGLHPRLTVEAATRAALGAGAKVTNTYERKLSAKDISRLNNHRPDIILLSGGTDGGNSEVILHNAQALLQLDDDIPVVVAGNAAVSGQVKETLIQRFSVVRVTENLLPELNILNVDPCRRTIRELFMQNIIRAKGWHKAEALIDRVLMPTPAAVLTAAELLACGPGRRCSSCGDHGAGLGEIMVVDVGGATTDIHSIGNGSTDCEGVIHKGLPEPHAKRTVEGDLGVRFGAHSILTDASAQAILKAHLPGNPQDPDVKRYLESVVNHPRHLPASRKDKMIDTALARAATELAVNRHVGFRKEIYSPTGRRVLQYGKDLRGVRFVIGTGGPIVNSPRPRTILEGAASADDEQLLKPVSPAFLLDTHYIMAAMGLLAQIDPLSAFNVLKGNLRHIPSPDPGKISQ